MFCGSVLGTWQAKNQSARAHHISEGENRSLKCLTFDYRDEDESRVV
jgi:hypothetical protein